MNAPARPSRPIAHDSVSRAFGAAHGYDRHAPVQHRIAQGLARRIAALDLAPAPAVFEFGCGTGFLTQALLAETALASPQARWRVTDLAPAMLARCHERLGPRANLQLSTLDAEYAEPEDGPFDLIASSLALQWFDDPLAALARMGGWLAPGGHLMVTTLGAGTFAEWRAAHTALGLEAGTPPFLDARRFAALAGAQVRVEPIVEHPGSARAFLRALKAIGAGTPRTGHRPLAPAELRAVMAQFERNPCTATYEVVTIHLARPSEPETPALRPDTQPSRPDPR
ncbi:methyltransferase [Novosphingobium sp. 1949]|uniref:Methyltransferase n=1 Tax=Novosphingobium organovorum TaxID=2930092 RepID=A0ABT0BI48_9SPHN|nr:methyltransferase [Novosphingobium organovorum]MCJ2184699.1 methyltransferase [Novosphingobium organovorum]